MYMYNKIYFFVFLFCRPRDGQPQVVAEDQGNEPDLQNLMQVLVHAINR